MQAIIGRPRVVLERVSKPRRPIPVTCLLCGAELVVIHRPRMVTFRIGAERLGILCHTCAQTDALTLTETR